MLGEDSEDVEDSSGSNSGKDQRKDEERTLEIRTVDGDRVKQEIRKDEIRTEIRSGGTRLKLERKDGELKMKMEQEDGEEEELEDQDRLRIREREDENEFEVEAGEEEGEFVVRRGQTTAHTRFPLSINLLTNELVVTTPAGERVVTVLPDQAVQNMLGANVIDQLQAAVASPGAALAAGTITLGERQGVPVYEIAGIRHHKFLGFIPVQTQVTAVVSAETGELVGTEDVSLVEQVVSLLSVN